MNEEAPIISRDFDANTEQDSPLVLALDDVSATLEHVGGKGSSLARLAAAGLPVPPGFHITTTAYRLFVAKHGLQEQILAAVSTTSPNQPATCDAAAQTRRAKRRAVREAQRLVRPTARNTPTRWALNAYRCAGTATSTSSGAGR